MHCNTELQLLMHSCVCHFNGALCSLGILFCLNKLKNVDPESVYELISGHLELTGTYLQGHKEN